MGVAGAGKTTMLRAVADAFERSGCEVIGTATSGQAARNLGHEAEIAQSRTLASLIWRLDHGQMALNEKTVVILDEVGMTDDADLARLAAYTELAGAKLVLTGDHRQLGPVGPGGALGALVKRHPDAVHYLGENRRQRDPGERQALEALRDGDVGEAVSWYAEHGRVHAVPSRDEALQAAVEAWAADVAAGHETGLYAWRRANVAELNRRARAWMEATGRLSGPELACPGGAAYRAGDRVVTLAPGPGGSLVTSERATVEARRRRQRLSRSPYRRRAAGPPRAARSRRRPAGATAYATTVHRSQGSTVARAHLFADGGGRELAYVAMSRARQSHPCLGRRRRRGPSRRRPLRRSGSARRTPSWAIRHWACRATRRPYAERRGRTPGERRGPCGRPRPGPNEVQRRRRKGRQAARGQKSWAQLVPRLARAEQDLSDLRAGAGTYRGTEAGRAVSDLARAQARLGSSRVGGRAQQALARIAGRPPKSPPLCRASSPTPNSVGGRTSCLRWPVSKRSSTRPAKMSNCWSRARIARWLAGASWRSGATRPGALLNGSPLAWPATGKGSTGRIATRPSMLGALTT